MSKGTRVAAFIVGGALLGALGGVSVAIGLWWLAWIVWGVYFAVVEGLALFNSRGGDTLSEHVWLWFGTNYRAGDNPRSPNGWTRLRRFALLAFMVWLLVHFMTGGIV